MHNLNKINIGVGLLGIFVLVLVYVFLISNANTNTGAADTAELKKAVDLALLDEIKAHNFYKQILEDKGQVRPFANIVNAESRHIQALLNLYDKYSWALPVEPNHSFLTDKNLESLCADGVVAEVENVKLYQEKLLPTVTGYPDITNVFTNLMNASEQNHLPAFKRCAGIN